MIWFIVGKYCFYTIGTITFFLELYIHFIYISIVFVSEEGPYITVLKSSMVYLSVDYISVIQDLIMKGKNGQKE